MPSPALVAFCVFGVISIVAITVQLFMWLLPHQVVATLTGYVSSG